MRRRWDGDERGHGVAGGESHKPHALRLVKALELPDWVAEDPELHLLPHLERAALGLGFGLGGAALDGATHVHEWVDGDAVVFDVATGMVAEDGHFAPHGHLLRLRVA